MWQWHVMCCPTCRTPCDCCRYKSSEQQPLPVAWMSCNLYLGAGCCLSLVYMALATIAPKACHAVTALSGMLTVLAVTVVAIERAITDTRAHDETIASKSMSQSNRHYHAALAAHALAAQQVCCSVRSYKHLPTLMLSCGRGICSHTNSCIHRSLHTPVRATAVPLHCC
jgi:hypothetical protein